MSTKRRALPEARSVTGSGHGGLAGTGQGAWAQEPADANPSPAGLTVRSLEEKPNFRDLQMWAGAQLRNLATLPLELRLPLLGALRDLLQDPRALQELEDMVRGPPIGQTRAGGWHPGQRGLG